MIAVDIRIHNTSWSKDDVGDLKYLFEKGYTAEQLAEVLGRTVGAVRGKIYRLNLHR